jgi:hypothetical protein
MTRIARTWLLLGLLLLGPWSAGIAVGQEVRLRGSGDVSLDHRMARLLERSPLVVSRDTTFTPADTIRGSVLVLDATLIHEGVILGDLVGVDAGAFIRPYAVIAGDLVNISGGLYRSELAAVGGRVVDLPVAAYRVVRDGDQLVIEATGSDSPLELDGALGFQAPTYDRVNGLTLVWGAAYHLPRVERVQSRVHAQLGWLTQRGDPTYQVDVSLRRGATELSIGHERAWDTNERWIRGDLMNSLGFLTTGGDYRDYHEVDRSWAELTRGLADGTGRFQGRLTLRGQVEDATSLTAGSPWTLFGSEVRTNPAVDDGRVTSVVAGTDLQWSGDQTRFVGRLEAEAAREIVRGRADFGRISAEGSWAMLAFANHTLTIDYFLQRPLGGDPLPRQRWSLVGGANTLHTLAFGEFQGDHVVFVETNYIIPLPDRLALPILGSPRVHILHAAGNAWTGGEDRSLHQEVGFRLDLGLVYVRYAFVPEDPAIDDLSVGLAWPFGRRYPWE